MCADKVIYIDIVTHSCPVRSIIVISENEDFFSLSESHIEDIWEEIIRYTIRDFSDISRGMRADRIKVS